MMGNDFGNRAGGARREVPGDRLGVGDWCRLWWLLW